MKIVLISSDPSGSFSLGPRPLAGLIPPGKSYSFTIRLQNGPMVFERLCLGPRRGVSTIGPEGISPIGAQGPAWDAAAWRIDEVTIDEVLVDHRQVGCGVGSRFFLRVTNIGEVPAHFYASWECDEVQRADVPGAVVTAEHTCSVGGRGRCARCLQIEGKLWDAINGYAISIGGDPSKAIYGNVPRMQAVVDVGVAIGEMVSTSASIMTASSLPAASALPTNPDCTGTVGKDFVTCGEEGYYCSDRCWTIGRLGAARAQVAEYERQLGVYAVRDPEPVRDTGGGAP